MSGYYAFFRIVRVPPHPAAPFRRDSGRLVVIESSESVHGDIYPYVGRIELCRQFRIALEHHDESFAQHGIEILIGQPPQRRQPAGRCPVPFAGFPEVFEPHIAVCAHIDGHEQVAVAACHPVQRQRIENAAVDKEHLSVPLRLEKCGNGDRGPDGFVQTSRIVHDFAVVGQVCRHRTEWNGKRFDGNIRHDFP